MMNISSLLKLPRYLVVWLIVAAFLAPTLTQQAIASPITVKSWKKWFNFSGEEKNDFHVKAWQKEDNIDIVDWTVVIKDDFGGDLTVMEANQPLPDHDLLRNRTGREESPPTTDPDNGKHAIDIWLQNAVIPHNSVVNVDVEFQLTSFNTIRWHGAEFTKDLVPVPPTPPGDGGGDRAGPNEGIEIEDPVEMGGGIFSHHITFFNDDNMGTSELMRVTGLKFGFVPNFNVIDDTFASAFMDFSIPLPDFDLTPGGAFSFDVLTPGQLGGGGIFADWGVVDAIGNLQTTTRIAHEVVPEPASLFLLITGGFAMTIFRRKKLIVCSKDGLNMAIEPVFVLN